MAGSATFISRMKYVVVAPFIVRATENNRQPAAGFRSASQHDIEQVRQSLCLMARVEARGLKQELCACVCVYIFGFMLGHRHFMILKSKWRK